ncbi:MAG: sigma-70 family RNA polymerase sigma factor [Actinomycetota bacterium]
MGEAGQIVARALRGGSAGLLALDQAVDEARSSGNETLNTFLDPLAAEAAAGNETAVGILIGLLDNHELCRPGIRSLLLDQRQIEEAEQLTLIAVHRYIATFEGRAGFTTWLYRVAKNEASRLLTGEAKLDHDRIEDRVDFPAGLRRLSSLIVTRKVLSEMLEQAMAELTEDQAEALRLREVDGLSYREIAERTGADLGTVKSRINRARQRCMAALGIDLPGLDADGSPAGPSDDAS